MENKYQSAEEEETKEPTDAEVSEEEALMETGAAEKEPEEEAPMETESEEEEPEKRVLFQKAAQGYGMILGFGFGYILSGILTELGIPAGKFECVILGMFAGMAIGFLVSNRKEKK